MYQALYRKWRPRTFDDVVGQEHITETLKTQIITGRLSHAYLFIGTRGTGKTTCAKILARAVNCEHPVNGNPCNECASCRGIEDGSIMDVVEMDAASNNSVDNVRALRDEAVFSPAQVKKRVYIVDEVHMLSNSAFNALLKILEEPPEHLMFILATTELQKVPATILSRCQRHSFKRLSTQAIAGRLGYVAAQENMDLTADAAELIARLADGGMRDGLSLLDQCSGASHIDVEAVYSAMGLAGNLRTADILRNVAAGNTDGVLSAFQDLYNDGKDPAAFLNELAVLQRDILMTRVAPKGGNALLCGGFDGRTLNELGGLLANEQLLRNLELLQVTSGGMKNTQNPKLAAELCLVRMCEPELNEDISSLAARVSRLENMLKNGVVTAPAPISGTPAAATPRPSEQRTAAPVAPTAPETPVTPRPAPEPRPVYEPTPREEPHVPVAPVAPEPPRHESPAPAPDDIRDSAPAPAENGELLERFMAKLAAPEYKGIQVFLSNPVQTECVFSGKHLTIYAKDKFVLTALSREPNSSKIRAVATEVLGEPVILKIQPPGEAPAKQPKSNFEDLLKFNNVTIK